MAVRTVHTSSRLAWAGLRPHARSARSVGCAFNRIPSASARTRVAAAASPPASLVQAHGADRQRDARLTPDTRRWVERLVDQRQTNDAVELD